MDRHSLMGVSRVKTELAKILIKNPNSFSLHSLQVPALKKVKAPLTLPWAISLLPQLQLCETSHGHAMSFIWKSLVQDFAV